jgi:hypothetical protein
MPTEKTSFDETARYIYFDPHILKAASAIVSVSLKKTVWSIIVKIILKSLDNHNAAFSKARHLLQFTVLPIYQSMVLQ